MYGILLTVLIVVSAQLLSRLLALLAVKPQRKSATNFAYDPWKVDEQEQQQPFKRSNVNDNKADHDERAVKAGDGQDTFPFKMKEHKAPLGAHHDVMSPLEQKQGLGATGDANANSVDAQKKTQLPKTSKLLQGKWLTLFMHTCICVVCLVM